MKQTRHTFKSLWRGLLVGAMLLGASGVTWAQETIVVGDGTGTSNQGPFGNHRATCWVQTIYAASEIGLPTGGTISEIAFNCSKVKSGFVAPTVTIYMGVTTMDEHSTKSDWVPMADLTEVYSGTDAQPTTTGWHTITLATPFDYNGVDNLVIAVLRNGTANATEQTYYITSKTNTVLFKNDVTGHPGTTAGTGTVKNRANLKLTVTRHAGCYPVENLTVGTAARTYAPLSWNAPSLSTPVGYEVEYGPHGFTPGTGLKVYPTATSVTLTGLNPSTRYDAYVRTICGVGDTAATSVSTTFTTECGPMSAPYYEDFSTANTYSSYAPTVVQPTCWEFPGLSATATGYPKAYVNKNNNLILQAAKSGSDAYAILPVIDAHLENYAVSIIVGDKSITGEFTLGYLMDASDPTGFRPLGNITSIGTFLYDMEEDYDEVPYGARLAVRAHGTTATAYIRIDSISITPAPECKKPYGLTVDSAGLSTTSIRVTWSGEQDTADRYRVRYMQATPTGSFTSSDTLTAATGLREQAYSFTGLPSGTVHRIFVDKLCHGAYTDSVVITVSTYGELWLSSESDEMGYVDFQPYGPRLTSTTATAYALPHYHFVQWSDSNTANPANFLFRPAALATPVQAQFAPDTHHVAFAVNDATMGSVNAEDGDYAYGSSLTLVATPAAGYTFAGWSDGDTNASRTYTVLRDATLTARFCPEGTLLITAAVSDAALGSVATVPADGLVAAGDEVTLTATLTDADHYDFRWEPTPDTVYVSGSLFVAKVTATESRLYSAVVTPKHYTLAATAQDSTLGSVLGAGTYEYGDSVQIMAKPADRAKFVSWSGDIASASNPITIFMDGDKSLSALFRRDSVTINVAVPYAEQGTVAIVTADGGTSARVAVGDTVNLFAVASSEHYSFHNWSNGSVVADQHLVAFGRDGSSRTYNALFSPERLSVSAVPNISGAGAVYGAGTYGYNSVAYLEAEPAEHYSFVQWVSDDTVATANPFRPLVLKSTGYTAVFAPEALSITADVDDPAHGSATVNGEVAYNRSVTLVATPDSGWSFVNWTDDAGNVVSTMRNYTFAAVASGTFTAHFEQAEYHVTVTATTGKGSIVGGAIDATYHFGDIITVTAANADASLYDFAGWNVEGGSGESLTYRVTGSVDIVATYRTKGRFVVVASANNNAWGTVVTDQEDYAPGSNAFVQAVPAANYRLARWSDTASSNNGRLVNMTSDITLTAIFEPMPYRVELAANDSTMGSVWSVGAQEYNSEITVTAIPAKGRHLTGWTGLAGNDASVSFVLVSDTVITANFAPDTINVTVSGDHATTTGSGTYAYGTRVTIDATPDDHYEFLSWSDNHGSNPRSVVVDSVENFVAICGPIRYTVTGVSNNPALGYVTGSETRPYGSANSRLEAYANPNARFVGWDDGETAASRLISFDANQTYTALFVIDSFQVTLAAADAAKGSVNTDINGKYEYNASIELVATPNDGVSFSAWSDGDSTNPRVIVVREDISGLTALFDSIDYYLDTTTNDNLKGHIVLSPAKASYKYNEEVTVSYVNHNPGLYRFVAWEDGTTADSRTLRMTTDRSVVAIFDEADKYSVAVMSNDNTLGQALGSASSVDNLTTHTIIARAAEHCHFVAWSDNGSTDTLRTVTLAGSDFVSMAIFAMDSLDLLVNVSHADRGYVSGVATATTVRLPYGAQVNLQAVAQPHVTFTGWSNGESNAAYNFTLTTDTALVANFTVDSFAVAVLSSDDTQGGVNAALVASRRYAYGEIVSLEATPAVGYEFLHWTPGNSSTNPLVFQVTDAITYTANFAARELHLTAQSNDLTMGSVIATPAQATYAYGQTVALSARLADTNRFRFISWSDGVTDTLRNVTLTDDTELMAIFAEAGKYAVAVVSDGSEQGSVSTTATSVYANQTVTVTAAPAAHHHFLGWSDGTTDSIYTLTVTADTLLVASFEIDSFTVSLTATGSGVVAGAGTYAYGSTVTVYATADEHNHFLGWSDGVMANPRQMMVDGDIDLTATFALDTVEITTVAVHGSVTGNGSYAYGESVTLTATAEDSIYGFDGWTRNGVAVSGSETLTFTAEENAHYVANFILVVDTMPVFHNVIALSGNDEMGSVVASATRVLENSTVTVTATPAAHHHFLGWSDGTTDSIYTFAVTADTLLVANFEIDIHTVSLTATGNGVVAGAGTYAYGSTVTIYATADEHNHFLGWSDSVMDNPRQMVVDGDTSLTATFALDTVEITTAGIFGSVTGSGSYAYGESVTLTATADSSIYGFDGWTRNGVAVSGSETLTFTAEEDAHYVANFILVVDTMPVFHNVIALSGNDEMGSVVASATRVHEDSTVTVTASPAAHHHFLGWSDGIADSIYTFAVTADTLLVANFEIDSFTVSLTAIGNGAVAGAGTYAYGSAVTVYATADEHNHFLGWSDGSIANPRQIVVDSNIDLTATFALDTVEIITAAVHGSVTGSGSYAYGESVTLTATADSSIYGFAGWTRNGVAVSGSETLTFTAEENAHYVANFILVVDTMPVFHNVIALSGNDEMGSVVASATRVHEDSTVTVTATPAAHHHFLGWSDGTTDSIYTLTVTADTLLVASFEIDTHTVSLTATGNGVVAGAGTYAYGSTVTIYATADEHNHFLGWSDSVMANPRQIVVDSNIDLTATFALDTVEITAAAIHGSVTGDSLYTYGDTVTLIATAEDTLYSFAGWTRNGIAVSGTDTLSFVAEESAYYVAAFELVADTTPVVPAVYSVTVVSNNEDWGTVSASEVDSASVVTVRATAADHYEFLGWNDGTTDSVYTFTLTSDTLLVAYFQPVRYTVTLSGSSVTLVGDGLYEYGDEATVCAIADDGFHFDGWVDANGNTVSTDMCYTFTVEGNVGLMAAVTADDMVLYTISTVAEPMAAGRVLVTINGATVNQGRYGDTVTVTAQANEGYTFTGWEGSSLPWASLINGYTFTFVLTEDVTLVANFDERVGIEDADEAEVRLYAASTVLHVSGAHGERVRVFDAVGRLVADVEALSPEFEVSLPSTGIYMVVVGERKAQRIAAVR